MIFEPLKYEHLDQMVEIEKEAFATPWTKNMFIPELTSSDAHYLVGVRGGEVVCYGGYYKVVDEAHITNIAVKSNYRGKGYGKLLLSRLIADAQINGIQKMTLEVRDGNNAAIQMYLGFGFEVEGVRKKYYENKFDALIMWADIGGQTGKDTRQQ